MSYLPPNGFHARKTQPNYRLGTYSDFSGFSSILFSVQNDEYRILKLWSDSGLVSINKGVKETLTLLEELEGEKVWSYSNGTKAVLNLVKQQNKGEIEKFFTPEIEILETFQIINSLLAEGRIKVAEGLGEIETTLRLFDVEKINPIVYSLFYSIGFIELWKISNRNRVKPIGSRTYTTFR